MRIIAHRGGTDHYPELTLAAAKHSIELGADVVEMDIRFTMDGIPVISHDEDANYLFGVDRRISDMTYEQFSQLKFKEAPSYRPHSLEEILSSGVAPILLHIKEGGEKLRHILRLIHQFGYEDNVIMGVEKLEDVHTVKDFHPAIKTLAFMPDPSLLKDYLRSDVEVIRLWETWLEHDSVLQIKQAGKEVWIMSGDLYGVIGQTDPAHLALWKQWGIDGVLIDRVQDYTPYK